jgi:hypothetical protein
MVQRWIGIASEDQSRGLPKISQKPIASGAEFSVRDS